MGGMGGREGRRGERGTGRGMGGREGRRGGTSPEEKGRRRHICRFLRCP